MKPNNQALKRFFDYLETAGKLPKLETAAADEDDVFDDVELEDAPEQEAPSFASALARTI